MKNIIVGTLLTIFAGIVLLIVMNLCTIKIFVDKPTDLEKITNGINSIVYVNDATNDLKTSLTNVFYEKRPWDEHNIAIGVNTGYDLTNSYCILLGNNAQATKDRELVIKFEDGTEWRMNLPTNTVIDMRGMWPENVKKDNDKKSVNMKRD